MKEKSHSMKYILHMHQIDTRLLGWTREELRRVFKLMLAG